MYINSKMPKILLILILIIISIVSTSRADIVNKIEIQGNDRISTQTIINFSEVVLGKNLNDKDLNSYLKNLYDTNFFEDVNLELKNNILIIKVKEFPIIQQIKVNGIKAEKTIKELKDQIVLKEKNPFNEILVKDDLDTISNIFKNSGYYFVDVKVSVEKNENQTVNLIFDIDRGEQATIKSIKFIGDKKYKDRKLHGIITSEENRFWKVLTRSKYINIERINLDKRLLKNFYLNKGFYNVEINDAYTKLINNKDFILTYNINAGDRFKFGSFVLDLPSDYDKNDFLKIENVFEKLKNTQYSLNKIEDILDEIDKIALNKNYEFINANVNETINNDKIDFVFKILETKKTYVNRINFYGNNITSEEFLRSNLLVDEGDPFNKILHNKSINNLKSKGLFASVQTKIIETDDEV